MMSPARFGVERPVVANLVMLAIIGAGLIFGIGLRREFFPPIDANQVLIVAPYPGASPDEVERSLARKIEDRLDDLDGVDEIRTTATEGAATITVEFVEGEDIDTAVADVKREIDALQDLPDESDRIIVSKIEPNLPVIVLSLYAGQDERLMKRAIRAIRDDLRTLPGMGDLLLSGVRTDEIVVEVRPAALLEHGLSIADVSDRIHAAMIELPGGSVRTATSTISIRTVGADERADQVRRIVVKASAAGQVVRVADVAKVTPGFADVDIRERLNGQPSVSLTIFKVGKEDAVEMAAMVKAYAAGLEGQRVAPTLTERIRLAMRRPGRTEPVSSRLEANELGLARHAGGALPGRIALTTDLARFIQGRLNLLKRNALWGGLLVFLTLVLLLNWRVSLWVAAGLVVSLLGTLAAMSLLGVTLNLLTMFGLIVVIGLLVDDAIVVSENIVARHERGEPALSAAVSGTRQVAWPVVATVLTTIAAFMPLALVQGRLGDMLEMFPVVVSVALGVSLIEAMLILPCHMGHSLLRADRRHNSAHVGVLERIEDRFDRSRDALFQRVILPRYSALLSACLRRRYLTMSVAIAVLIGSASLVAGGVLRFIFFETNDSETVNVELRMPIGTPIARTDEVVRRLEAACMAQPEVKSVYASVGQIGDINGEEASTSQPHLAQLVFELKPVEERDRTSEDVILSIRKRVGELPGIKSLSMRPVTGGPEGPGVSLTVTGEDPRAIAPAVERIEQLLREYSAVYDIADDADAGQRELQFHLRPGASELGLTTQNVARQVRGAVFGLEPHTFAGDGEDVDVRVMYPESARRSPAAIERMFLFTPSGTPVPLAEVVQVTEGRSYATVRRLDRRRAVTVTAEVEHALASPEEVMSSLRPQLRRIERESMGLRILERGRQKEFAESMSTLPIGMAVALALMYVVLAWLFNSFAQPLLVMSAIPFATVGVVLGHLALGYKMTFLSLIGFIALTGVAVNDSLIFIDFFNQKRREGHGLYQAAIEAGRARIRAIILTTVTTVLGLMPLMLERSFQAKFLIPMAITISFGLMATTLVVLVALPTLLLILDDVRRLGRSAWTGRIEPWPILPSGPLAGPAVALDAAGTGAGGLAGALQDDVAPSASPDRP